MKIIQKYPLNWLGQFTFDLKEDGVRVEWKSKVMKVVEEYKFKNMASEVVEFEKGNENWTNYGIALIFIGVVMDFLRIFGPYQLPAFAVTVILAGYCFLMRFNKHEFYGFKDKNDNNLFSIRISDSREDKEFAERIIEEIKKAGGNTISQTDNIRNIPEI